MTKARDIASATTPNANAALLATFPHRNLIINGAMQVAQRGTSFSVSAGTVKTLDRFEFQEGTGGATTYTVTQDSDAPSNFAKSLKIVNSTAVTLSSNQYGLFLYPIEGFDIIQTGMGTSAAKDLTLSFWVKSSLTGNFGVALRAGVATTANYIAEYTIVSANTWEYKTITYPATSSGTWNTDNTIGAAIVFDLGTGSNFTNTSGTWNTAGTNKFGLTGGTALNGTAGATLNITGIQLELGDTATPFEHRSFGDELARCQRYYQQWGPSSETHLRAFAGSYTTGVYVSNHFLFPTIMRATPSFAVPSGPTYQNAGSFGTGSVSTTGVTLYSISTSTSVIAGFYIDNNNSDYAYADAEL